MTPDSALIHTELTRTAAQINRTAVQWHSLIQRRVLGSGLDASWTADMARLQRMLDELFARKRAILNAKRVSVDGARKRGRGTGTRRAAPPIFTRALGENERSSPS